MRTGRSRRRKGGSGSQLVFKPDYDEDDPVREAPWSVSTYPYPDKRLAPPRNVELATSTERLFWRSSGALAYRAGVEYPVELREQLCTLEELFA